MDTNTRTSNPNQARRALETEASTIFDKILSTDIPRSVFYINGRVHSCPVGGRLETRYFDRRDSLFVGTYDTRATLSMIIEDLHLA